MGKGRKYRCFGKRAGLCTSPCYWMLLHLGMCLKRSLVTDIDLKIPCHHLVCTGHGRAGMGWDAAWPGSDAARSPQDGAQRPAGAACGAPAARTRWGDLFSPKRRRLLLLRSPCRADPRADRRRVRWVLTRAAQLTLALAARAVGSRVPDGGVCALRGGCHPARLMWGW